MSALAALLSAAILGLAAIAAAALTARARPRQAEADQPALSCALLGFVLAAATGATLLADGLGIRPFGEASRWLARASYQLGVPLVALAIFARGHGWSWSRPTWGRVVLGLCVTFEVARQLGWGQPYALTLATASALAVLQVALRQRADVTRLAAGLAGGALLLALAPFPGSPTAGFEPLVLGLSALPLAWLLCGLPSRAATAGEV
ncbi:hypothetical protein [Stutzerimonas azotifigens]|uniref:hypothetical protein n=1 Tax=Stutzerimonas azotifigens TaxID=291995 RepID=UPI00040F779D|nr:hypothetical protein [Stutzerimonas azotifigens]